MQIGICSYSFHRLLAAGKQDIFRYITDCKELGCTQLDPWNVHLASIYQTDQAINVGRNPAGSTFISAADDEYIAQVKEAAEKAGLPFGTIAVDGAHIYEDDPEKRLANRARAYRWLDIAKQLGATQVRIDAGGPPDMPDHAFQIIREGYRDLIDRAKPIGIEILVENHWGPTNQPDNIIKLMEFIEGLGLLYDTNNWQTELRTEARARCAKYATAVHVKTFAWDDAGNETEADIPTAVGHLLKAGYKGVWGIESCPHDGDEYAGAKKTIALIRRLAGKEGKA